MKGMDTIITIFGSIWIVLMYIGMIAFPIALLYLIIGSVINIFKKDDRSSSLGSK